MANQDRNNGKNNVSNLKDLTKMIQEKFPNLLLGIMVLVVAFVLLFSYIQRKNNTSNVKPTGFNQSFSWLFGKKQQPTPTPTSQVKKYKVQKGDYLWKIAEASYGSGFNAYDIAKANNIKNPNVIEPGQELVLPSASPKQPTMGEVAMATSGKVMQHPGTYTIKRGDYLWKIAQEFYGDGFAWVKIAKTNHLANPNLIHADNKLILP